MYFMSDNILCPKNATFKIQDPAVAVVSPVFKRKIL